MFAISINFARRAHICPRHRTLRERKIGRIWAKSRLRQTRSRSDDVTAGGLLHLLLIDRIRRYHYLDKAFKTVGPRTRRLASVRTPTFGKSVERGYDGFRRASQRLDVGVAEPSGRLASAPATCGPASTSWRNLVMGSLGLPELLAEVSRFAIHAIPGADGAGVTLLRSGRADTAVEALAASAAFVTEIEEIQHVTLREGPCITAALEQRTVWSGSLGGERMWPRFGPRVDRTGVHSALSLPLMLSGETIGAITGYAHVRDAFDEHAVRLGELFAKPAAVALHNARALVHALALTTQLRTALSTRPVIDQAIGVIRARSGRSTGEAFTHLRAISQSEHRKVADVAQRIVDDAVHRVRT